MKKTEVLRIDLNKPDKRGLDKIINILNNDGVIIYPTDSVYTLGCKISSKKGYQQLCNLKGIKPEKAQFSIVCADFSHLSNFAKQISNSQFRLLKNHFPGPFTFILEASKDASKYFHYPKKTIGIRIPDVLVVQMIIQQLEMPIFSASIQLESNSPYSKSADEILADYDGKVDLIIDGGLCGEVPTTIVDLTQGDIQIIRQGAGIL